MTTEQRLHSLDAVRAFALLCGIVLHATMSFSPAFATLGWPISDVSQSVVLQGTFHVLHGFRMMLFFLIAGLFARHLQTSRGTAGFWRNRLKRIGAPLVVGWVLVMPLVVATIVWGVIKKNGGLPGDGRAAAMAGSGIPLAHLWFLYYLLLMYAITLTTRWLADRIDGNGYLSNLADACLCWLVQKHVAVLALSIPLTLILYFSPGWIPWTGIPTPQTGLVPHLAALVSFGTAFVLGWFLHRQQHLLQVWARSWPIHLVLATSASALSMWMVGLTGSQAAITTEPERFAYASCYIFASWNWVLAIVGCATRHMSRVSPTVRYLADSSYWMYLVHLPLVFALQVTVMQWHLHWSIKLPLILTAAMIVLLASYQYLVRHTFLGRWLNGPSVDRVPIQSHTTSSNRSTTSTA